MCVGIDFATISIPLSWLLFRTGHPTIRHNKLSNFEVKKLVFEKQLGMEMWHLNVILAGRSGHALLKSKFTLHVAGHALATPF